MDLSRVIRAKKKMSFSFLRGGMNLAWTGRSCLNSVSFNWRLWKTFVLSSGRGGKGIACKAAKEGESAETTFA